MQLVDDMAVDTVDGDSKPHDSGDARGLTAGGPVAESGFSLVF
jgi:hypothetical protein